MDYIWPTHTNNLNNMLCIKVRCVCTINFNLLRIFVKFELRCNCRAVLPVFAMLAGVHVMRSDIFFCGNSLCIIHIWDFIYIVDFIIHEFIWELFQCSHASESLKTEESSLESNFNFLLLSVSYFKRILWYVLSLNANKSKCTHLLCNHIVAIRITQ